jgi:hypothetical protein
MFEQERVIGRLQRRVLADPDILVCFLSGSMGKRTSDDYSDLDAALLFRDEERRERAWAARRDFTQSIMPYVAVKSFDAAHVRPFFHVALFSNGCKVDLRYETLETLQPNPWDAQIRILKDQRGWGETFQAASAQQALPQPRLRSDELQALDDRFWVMFWDALRLLKRGDVDKPFTVYLELLHFTLPGLLQTLPANDPARQNLLQANFSRDAQATLQHLTRLLDAYLAARGAVVQRHNLAFAPNRPFEREIQRLLERLMTA